MTAAKWVMLFIHTHYYELLNINNAVHEYAYYLEITTQVSIFSFI